MAVAFLHPLNTRDSIRTFRQFLRTKKPTVSIAVGSVCDGVPDEEDAPFGRTEERRRWADSADGDVRYVFDDKHLRQLHGVQVEDDRLVALKLRDCRLCLFSRFDVNICRRGMHAPDAT